jgi:F1F0 ATPase subunit 2
MNDALSLAFSLAAGASLGAFFFGGLWWTVRMGAASKRPALFFFGSLLLRTCMVVLGFHVVLGNDWRRLLAGLLGFILARVIMMRFILPRTGRAVQPTHASAREAGHAP